MKAELVVKGIIFDKKQGKILLIKRSKTDHIGADTWESAGGKVEAGETLEEALHREIMEETGLAVHIEKLAYASTLKLKEPVAILVYICSVENGDVVLSSEHCDARWVDKEECKLLVKGGVAEDFIKHGIYDMNWNENDANLS